MQVLYIKRKIISIRTKNELMRNHENTLTKGYGLRLYVCFEYYFLGSRRLGLGLFRLGELMKDLSIIFVYIHHIDSF